MKTKESQLPQWMLETGAASLHIELSKGHITVKHGEDGTVLVQRPCLLNEWSHRIFPVLQHMPSEPIQIH